MSGALSPRLKAVGREEYLKTWIEARSNVTEASEIVLPTESEEEGGITSQLYTACLEVFRDLYKLLAKSLFNKYTWCCPAIFQAAPSLPSLDDSKEHHLTLGDSCSPTQLHNPLSSFLTHNEIAISEVEKPDEHCGCKVASTDFVEKPDACIGTAPEMFNIRADGNDDEISHVNSAHGDLLDSQSGGSSGTIAKLKSLGKRSMKDALGKFFLWGHDLMDGGLDRSLGESDELRDHVLELLCSIAKILQSSMYQSSVIEGTTSHAR